MSSNQHNGDHSFTKMPQDQGAIDGTEPNLTNNNIHVLLSTNEEGNPLNSSSSQPNHPSQNNHMKKPANSTNLNVTQSSVYTETFNEAISTTGNLRPNMPHPPKETIPENGNGNTDIVLLMDSNGKFIDTGKFSHQQVLIKDIHADYFISN
ncbi:hypothetical protein OS493_007054 [Desmophyllum pertusum]|uniref:Uncharacterized protein n=1 Tax=Desmophyllum pertusum TaxID=174260 RepID=A0A9W9ZFG6_9CNID|nr:hypothetical protein OS493_007054 [Desmophyllum pertusum]